MVAIAWFALLVSSPIFNSLVGKQWLIPDASNSLIWIDFTKVFILGVTVVLASIQPKTRPIRGFVLALLALSLGYLVVNAVERGEHWVNFQGLVMTHEWVRADSLLQSIPALFMLLLAHVQGNNAASLFLTRGNFSTLSRLQLFGKRHSWKTLTPIFAILSMCVTGAFLVLRLDLSFNESLSKLGAALPIVILFPVLNAINEEIRFRNVLLAETESVLGRNSALLLTTVLFGLAHFGSFLGTQGPEGSLFSGLTYASGAALMGWVLGASILDTRGVLAAWIIHAFADLVIILGYVLAP